MPVDSLDSAHAGSRRWSIDPDCGQAEGLGRQHVVIHALANVQNAVSRNPDAAECEFENLQ